MEEFSRGRPDGKPSDPGEGGAAVRTPSKGDSSSPGTPPPSDSPTLIDIPGPSTPAPCLRFSDDGGHPGQQSLGFADHGGPLGPTLRPWSRAQSSPRQARAADAQRVQSNPSMLQPGAILGQRYEILQILGEGGMGAVYKARDRELNRMVALKVIRPELAGSQAIIDRFKQELLLATQVTHKNVIRIYDLSEADGMKFITMEYVEGEDLRGLMQKKGKLAPGGSGRDHAAGLPRAGSRAQRGHHSPRPEAAKHHARQDRPHPGHGLRPGPHARRRRHDPDRRPGRHHGLHVPGTGPGQGFGPALRPVHAGPDLLRTADRQDAVQGRQRRGQPAQAHPGTGRPGFEPRRLHTRPAQQHRQQMHGSRRQAALREFSQIWPIWKPGRADAPPQP